MKKLSSFIVLALAVCLSLSACSERNVNVSDNSSAPNISNENTPVTEVANEPPEEPDSNNLNTSEDENSLEIGASNSSYKQLSISLPCIGDEERTKVVTLVCPTSWTILEGSSTINVNGKKVLAVYCYSPESESMKNTLERLKTAETKEIGDKSFWIISEEYNILEKPKWSPYIIWSYYYYDGELYYDIDFFQNQDEPQMSIEEFESMLTTLQIN
jgi:hypothetical protein